MLSMRLSILSSLYSRLSSLTLLNFMHSFWKFESKCSIQRIYAVAQITHAYWYLSVCIFWNAGTRTKGSYFITPQSSGVLSPYLKPYIKAILWKAKHVPCTLSSVLGSLEGTRDDRYDLVGRCFMFWCIFYMSVHLVSVCAWSHRTMKALGWEETLEGS